MKWNTPISWNSFWEKFKDYTFNDISWPSDSFKTSSFFTDLSIPNKAKSTSIVFLNQKNAIQLTVLPALAFVQICPNLKGYKWEFPVVYVANIYKVMVSILNQFQFDLYCNKPKYIDVKASVHSSAQVEGIVKENAVVSAQCFVGNNTVIEPGVVLEPQVVIHDNCRIQAGSYIQSGVVIGSAGFGFFQDNDFKYYPIPHLAGVNIGKNVYIGANSVICASVLDPTYIGDNCKIDSHAQVAHNTFIDTGARISSQFGMGGSTRIGKNFLAGGRVSISDHLSIGDQVTLAACSGVTKNISDHQVWGGFPAQPLKNWKRQKSWVKIHSQN